jgi:hypothetical protein
VGREPVRKFEDLEVWKEGMRLASGVYRVLREPPLSGTLTAFFEIDRNYSGVFTKLEI